ncbi:MAG TPA: SDR family oxidoreductase [Archangium sp.]|uniref:SDR family NAD(P)-dependent oxidoreductase n=1 Tax=Archangium sp. TaxID=1872627 RepID=UPI002E330C7E|nr:SDR family oxidoreductase [Archangium sp.]HEX5747361.1 SDR family oxidoreductase [Archangium sp.]
MQQGLAGRVALVTGGGVRLGRALAEALGRAGATVAVHCHGSRNEAESVVGTLQAAGGRARVFQADLSRSESIAPLVSQVERELGALSILVNSAARFDRAAFVETPEASLEACWALNTRAPYLLSQEVARGMLARGGGDIINILDVGGALAPWRGYSAYGMTKAALAHLTQCLALELAPVIRVNGVAPGTVLPPEQMKPSLLETLRRRIPQQRIGAPSDVAEAVLFFLTGPTFITGQILAVDGGRMLE